MIASRLLPVLLGVLGLSLAALSGLFIIPPLTAATQSVLSVTGSIQAKPFSDTPEPAPKLVSALASAPIQLLPPEPAAPLDPTPSLGPVPPVVRPEPNYAAMVLDYLSDVGFGQEYGSASSVLHKWTRDVTLRVYGTPTAIDLITLDETVAELNRLLTGVQVRRTDGPADLKNYFAPEARFSTIEPRYVPRNLGFFRVWWDDQGAIYKGRILVASEEITQRERSHLIREELTQSLGLFQDSWQYPDSIFYQGWTATGEYSPIDAPTIKLLYQPQLLPGMTQGQVRDILTLD